jgi:AcrR family transcriptional regulator
MKQIPIQARAKQKRTALINAAEQCFREHGYDQSTAKNIATCAGVATGTFYQYFDNKDDMLRVIAQERLDELYTDVPNTEAQLLKTDDLDPLMSNIQQVFYQVLELSYDIHAQAPELHCILEQRRGLDESLDTILNRGEERLQQSILRFVQSFNTPAPEIIAQNLFAMSEGLIHQHALSPKQQTKYSKDDILNYGSKMLASYFENL